MSTGCSGYLGRAGVRAAELMRPRHDFAGFISRSAWRLWTRLIAGGHFPCSSHGRATIVLLSEDAAKMDAVDMAKSSKTDPVRFAVQFDASLLDEIKKKILG